MKKIIMIVVSIFLILGAITDYINFQNESVEALSKYGSRGAEVKQIQQKLKNWGYYKGNVDRCIW